MGSFRETFEQAERKGAGVIDGDDAAMVLAVVTQAEAVVASWESGDLAGAVRMLSGTLDEFDGRA